MNELDNPFSDLPHMVQAPPIKPHADLPPGWRWKVDGYNTIEPVDGRDCYVGINDCGNVVVHGITFRKSIQGRGARVVDADTARAIAYVVGININLEGEKP